jgi:hypothetical protein
MVRFSLFLNVAAVTFNGALPTAICGPFLSILPPLYHFTSREHRARHFLLSMTTYLSCVHISASFEGVYVFSPGNERLVATLVTRSSGSRNQYFQAPRKLLARILRMSVLNWDQEGRDTCTVLKRSLYI